jgi:lipopolysaccharide/colanic/teichoic acid biosynthesis glycosyltransferase
VDAIVTSPAERATGARSGTPGIALLDANGELVIDLSEGGRHEQPSSVGRSGRRASRSHWMLDALLLAACWAAVLAATATSRLLWMAPVAAVSAAACWLALYGRYRGSGATAYDVAADSIALMRPRAVTRPSTLVKRAFDVGVASIVLLFAAPLLLVTALAIKLGDGGPILFRQDRVGRHGRLFTMLKFRSMVVDAELLLDDLADANARTGPLFKAADDPRVTRVGRVLRATSIDELPQLFNVLRGEMSLVGPRPALSSETVHFSEDLLRRHEVLPGITGLWQVEGRDDADFARYEENDLFYVDNWSVGLDLSIVVRTPAVVARRALRQLTRAGRASVLD